MKDHSSNLDRREFLKATGMGLAGVSLAGLTIPSSLGAAEIKAPAVTPEKGASLRLLRWSGFVKSDEEVWNAHTKKWEELTGNKMLIEYVAWEDVRAKAAMAASVGAGPDIVMGWYDDPHLYSNKLIDVSDIAEYLGKKYGGWYPVFHAYGYSPTLRRWVGIPIGAPAGVQNYRVSWFKEAGYEKPPEKLDELLQCCKKLKAIGHPAGYSFGHAVGDGNGCCYWLLFSFKGKTIEADNKTIAINRKETWDALEFGREFYEQLVPGVIGWLDPDNNKAFLSSQISLTRNAVSIYYAAREQFPEVAKDMGHANLAMGPLGRPVNELHKRSVTQRPHHVQRELVDGVRRDGHLMGRSEVADPEGLAEAVGPADIRHEVACGAPLDQLAELETRLIVFAGGHRDADGTGHLGAGGSVVRQHRLLKPGESKVLEELRLANSAQHVEPLVGVHHELHPVAERPSDGLDARPVRAGVGMVDLHLVIAASHGDVALRLINEVVRRILRPTTAAIGGNPVGHRAPKLVKRETSDLADQIPQPDVERAYGVARDSHAPDRSVRAVHSLPEALHEERVLAEEERLEACL